jgi:hypothetical protein
MGNNTKIDSKPKPLKGGILSVPLDTLAQLGTNSKKTSCCGGCGGDSEEDFKLNKGTVKSDKKRLQSRAKNKYLTNSLSLGLVDVVEEKRKHIQDADDYNEEQKYIRTYWNIFHCARKLDSSNGKITGKYCKNRLCLVCNRIRTAILINNYQPVFDTWEDPYFVTITAPTVNVEFLKGRILEMLSILNKMQGTIKKRLQRAKLDPMKGIRKLECTYRPITWKYHPHFHFIIEGKENAEAFYNLWLERSKHLGTSYKGQDIKKADSGSLSELFKYFTKVVSTVSTGDKTDRLVYLESLDNIFRAIKGTRTLQSFGFTLPKGQTDPEQEVFEEIAPSSEPEENESFVWNQTASDWINGSTGECLSNYRLSESLESISKRMVRIKKISSA